MTQLGVTPGRVISVLAEADGYLSFIGYRHRDVIPYDLAAECIQASSACRMMIGEIEESRVKDAGVREAGDELVRLLRLAYEHSRPEDVEADCKMELASDGTCWCRQVRAAIERWEYPWKTS